MKIDIDPAKIERLLTRGVMEVIEKDHLRKQLLSGKQLRIKLGFDPTGAKIHIGRAIVLRKLREFQDLGHTVVFIVGDATALIGDPSDKLDKRPRLTTEKIKENIKNYKAQVAKIVNLRKAEFVFNSSWLKKLSFLEGIELARSFTVNQMLARRNFSERLEKHGKIGLEEMSYPLMQGYDSVMVKADVELGGFDQLFNLKAGRVIQERFGKPPQDIAMTEMLEGTDGRKMSTSWGNVINITDEPNDMFGKVMSVKDELIPKYFELCTDVSKEEVAKLSAHPKERKLYLAHEIVKLYHGEKAADEAKAAWEAQFSRGEMPADIPEIKFTVSKINLIDLLIETHCAQSKSEARRIVEQGGVRINGERKTNASEEITLNKETLIQVGPRKYVRVIPR